MNLQEKLTTPNACPCLWNAQAQANENCTGADKRKPPLGVTPGFIAYRERVEELCYGIIRMTADGRNDSMKNARKYADELRTAIWLMRDMEDDNDYV